MIPFAPVVSAHIRFLIHSVNGSNFDSIYRELCQLVGYGNDGSILMLQNCIDQANVKNGQIQNMAHRRDLISAIFRYLLDEPHFSTSVCEALGTTPVNEGLLTDLSNAFELSKSERISLGLALKECENPDLRMRGQNFCLAEIEELCENPISSLSNKQIQDIIMYLCRSENLSKHVDSLTSILSLLDVKESPFLMPVQHLRSDVNAIYSLRHSDVGCPDSDFDTILAEIEKEMSMAGIMIELGYSCTANILHCKEMLSLFQPLNDMTISKLLGAIVHTHTGLEVAWNTYETFCFAIGSSSSTIDSFPLNTWNVSVLVDSIKQLAPEANWIRVMENLDHEGFDVRDEAAFSILISIYSRACQDPFPLHAVCGSVWNNLDGQLSFLRYAVSAQPEVFTFAHCSRRLENADLVHLGYKQGNQAWFCLDLLEVLCQLAERGHASSVRLMLEFPLTQFPETAYNLLQGEVVSRVFPIILKDSTKNCIINYIWHVNPHLVVRGFIDAHSDPCLIERILDICIDLQILKALLDASSFSLCIKLAALASRKEHIDLEKWLRENLSIYKAAFFEVCIKFLEEVLSDLGNDVTESARQQSQAAVTNVFQEACSILLEVLQSYSVHLMPNHLVEDLKRLQRIITSNSRRAIITDIGTPEGSQEDIEAEANTYFHQMFSGQLSTDAMVQMLARFKESSDSRERLIFKCMIISLFEEFKFFPKYPDNYLKLAAVLFGSLIKHHLVTNLGLGIAVRGVLDALFLPAVSKMFMFGTKALEQFMDRLVDWPEYCNSILQSSHLRGAHGESVSAIEKMLSRIASRHTEPSDGNAHSSEQQGSGKSSVESTESSEASTPMAVSTSLQSGGHLSTSQLQQNSQSFFGKRLIASTLSFNNTEPLLSQSGQIPVAPKADASAAGQKLLDSSIHPSSSVNTVSGPQSLTSSVMLRPPSGGTGFGAANNIKTLLTAAEQTETPIEAPAEVQDKLFFMINNISTSNVDAKVKEFKKLLKEQFYPWFAQFMVMKRASIEPNFHDLYLKFLDKISSTALNKEIVKVSYENCQALLKSNLIKSSSEERSLLKNLGSWLGKFTIGRNQVLRANEINLKALIIEAYEKGLMIAIIPFTSKILEPCKSSIAYKPPTTWTMAILSLLCEIYYLPNLKMNLKFDIEVLFKHLDVGMKEVEPSSILKYRVRELEGNPDFSNKEVTASQTPIITEVSPRIVPLLSSVEIHNEVNNTSLTMSRPNILNQYISSVHLASSTMVEDDNDRTLLMPELVSSTKAITQISPSVSLSMLPTPSPFSHSQPLPNIPISDSCWRISPRLSSMGPQLQYKSLIEVAMKMAISRIIPTAIQEVVNIARKTTRELIVKDFVMESDDKVIYRAAHKMVGTCAGSLANVKCKESLRIALSNKLRYLLQSLNKNNEVNEQIIHILIDDNLDLGCAVICDVASYKANETIERDISKAFSELRKQREASGSAIYDAFTYSHAPLARVPEVLRPKPGHLSLPQQRVYDDFTKYHNQSSQYSSAGPAKTHLLLPRIDGSSSEQSNSTSYSTSQIAPFSSLSQPLDLISKESGQVSAQLFSGPTQIGTNAPAFEHVVAINSAAAQFPAALTSSGLPVVEKSIVTQDLVPKEIASSINAADRLGTVLPESVLTTGDALERYQELSEKLAMLIAQDAKETEIQGVVAEVPQIILRCVSRDEAALAVSQKVFKCLFEDALNSFHTAILFAMLVAIRDVCKLVVKELTSWVIYSDEEKKLNNEIIIGLIRSELVNLSEFNVHLAKLMDEGRNKAATEFGILLVQSLVRQEPGFSMSDLYNVIEALTKIAMKPGSPESLQRLIEILRNSSKNTPTFICSKEEKARQLREKMVLSGHSATNKEANNTTDTEPTDTLGFHDQVPVLFSEWCQIYDHPCTNDAAYSHYIWKLHQTGLLSGDDINDRFFRNLTELSVTYCLASERTTTSSGTPSVMSIQSSKQAHRLSYFHIDSYANLVVLILKFYPANQGSSKAVLLAKILSVVVRVIYKDAEENKSAFDPRPYFRLFNNWLLDLTSPELLIDGAYFQVLLLFSNAFHALQPLKVPGWSFAWLALVSHSSFMPKLLSCNPPKGWQCFHFLLVDLFKFMEPYLRDAILDEPVLFLYKSTLRVLLVLVHDFPEFLCDYYLSFCDVIPSSCIQMRNMVLSAFPRDMSFPDPSTPNLKIDLMVEVMQSPRILSDVDGILKSKQIKGAIDQYLKRTEGPFLTDLMHSLLLSPREAEMARTRYNVPLINSLVLYVGMQAIQEVQRKSATQHVSSEQTGHNLLMDTFLVKSALDIFQSLMEKLDTVGRYHFLNAVANQLRYPNSHTFFFSFVLLYLFKEASQEVIQEQIARVLLERVIVKRPHPWGLVNTFLELIKNPRYHFWSLSFARISREIEELIDKAARSFGVTIKPVDDAVVVATGAPGGNH